MAKRERVTPSLINEMAALHGIRLDPERLDPVVADLEVSMRKLDEVTHEALRNVEPAFIKPVRLPAPRRKQ